MEKYRVISKVKDTDTILHDSLHDSYKEAKQCYNELLLNEAKEYEPETTVKTGKEWLIYWSSEEFYSKVMYCETEPPMDAEMAECKGGLDTLFTWEPEELCVYDGSNPNITTKIEKVIV